MFIPILSEVEKNALAANNSGYLAGIIVTLVILGYLVYSLFKPEKF
jgi:K+-transporting ATPase KdpF subunit